MLKIHQKYGKNIFDNYEETSHRYSVKYFKKTQC